MKEYDYREGGLKIKREICVRLKYQQGSSLITEYHWSGCPLDCLACRACREDQSCTKSSRSELCQPFDLRKKFNNLDSFEFINSELFLFDQWMVNTTPSEWPFTGLVVDSRRALRDERFILGIQVDSRILFEVSAHRRRIGSYLIEFYPIWPYFFWNCPNVLEIKVLVLTFWETWAKLC